MLRAAPVRYALVCVVATVSLAQTGCEKSTLEGKLEDTKWNSAYVPDMFGISMRGVTMSLEFGADGSLKMGLKHAMFATLITGKWSYAGGEYVRMYDLSEALAGMYEHLEHITLAGDTLTMRDSDGTSITFTKLDDEMLRANNREAIKLEAKPSQPIDMKSHYGKNTKQKKDDGAGSYR